MMRLDDAQQALVETEQAQSAAGALVLHLRSGNDRVDFKRATGTATAQTRHLIASIAKLFTANQANAPKRPFGIMLSVRKTIEGHGDAA